MTWAVLVLNYFKALSLPLVLLTLGIVFRKSIQDIAHRFKRGKVAGVEIELEKTEVALRQADQLLEENQTSVSRIPGIPAIMGANPANPQGSSVALSSTEASEAHQKLDDQLAEHIEHARRRTIERVLQQGATFGWKWASMGRERPFLVVTWDGLGNPHIKATPEDHSGGGKSLTWTEMVVRRLEDIASGQGLLVPGKSLGVSYMLRIAEGFIAITLFSDIPGPISTRVQEVEKRKEVIGALFISYYPPSKALLDWANERSQDGCLKIELTSWSTSNDDVRLGEALSRVSGDVMAPF